MNTQILNSLNIVTDKYTFCLLLSDIFHIQIHLFQPEEVILNSRSDFTTDGYSVYILNLEGRFILLAPSVKPRRNSFTPSAGLVIGGTTRMALFDLRVCPDEGNCVIVGTFTPPTIKGNKVHSYTLKSTDQLYMVFPSHARLWSEVAMQDGEALYVYHDGTLLTCAHRNAKTNPYFYLPVSDECHVYLVIERTKEEADRAVQIEWKLN